MQILAAAFAGSIILAPAPAFALLTPTTTTLSSSPNPAPIGSQITYTATVASGGGTPGGLVLFKTGLLTLGSGTLDGSGQATFTTTATSQGTLPVFATYVGNISFLPSTSLTLNQIIAQDSCTISVQSSADPTSVGSPVMLTATVTNASGTTTTPTGNIDFSVAGVSVGSAALNGGGQASLNTTLSSTGALPVTASFSGDTNFIGCLSPTVTVTVNPSSTTTTLMSSVNPSASGQSVTFTATVASAGSGTPTGTVTFKDGSTTIGTGTLSSGQATFSTSALSLGTHSITADYGGDSNFAISSSAPLTQTVNSTASTTALIAAPNPSTFGQTVTFTATVSGAGGTPTGTVAFKDGTTTIGSASLNGSGQAVFTTSALTAGTHSITAVYAGDSTFSSSTSAPVSQSVNQNSSGVSVAAAPNPATAGSPVTLTATVSGSGGTPTGTVTFKDGATTIGSASLNGSGQAVLPFTFTSGTHAITAAYAGDLNFGAGTSAPLSLVVNAAGSTVTLASSANPAVAGQPVTFTATVAGTGGPPTGTVTFKDGAHVLGTAVLAGGVATFTTSSIRIGAHSITASYGGDSSFAAAVSAALQLTVSTPPDSAKLRALQIGATRIAAQVSGQAISGAIDSAIADAFAEDGELLRVTQNGMHMNYAAEPKPNRKVTNAFNALRKYPRPDWLLWTDVRGAGWDTTNKSQGDITGRQLNALSGLSHRVTNNFIVGIFGGMEGFDYQSAMLDGHLQGNGWTGGVYAAWRFYSNLRLDAGLARSGIDYRGVAGTATGNFSATRTLATVGLSGNYKLGHGFDLQPSLRYFRNAESDAAYTDSLGTAQAAHDFSTSRTSLGARLIYRWRTASGVTFAPYAGLYGDHYATSDSADVPQFAAPSINGNSMRAEAGLNLATLGGANLALGGELGGIGGDFREWALRARASIAF